MAKAGAVVGLIFTIAFTIIMANYTYHAWLESQAANKDVEIAKAELEQAKQDCYAAKSNYISQYGALPEGYNRSCETGQ